MNVIVFTNSARNEPVIASTTYAYGPYTTRYPGFHAHRRPVYESALAAPASESLSSFVQHDILPQQDYIESPLEQPQVQVQVRKYFPETWLWESIPADM